MTALLLDVPFHPGPDGFTVLLGEDRHDFSTRLKAMKFAMDLARTHVLRGGAAFVSVEGADGQWRLFKPDLSAPLE